MPFVSITRLRVRSWWYIPSFLSRALASQRQLSRSPGFRRGALSPSLRRVFWTVSVWDDDAAMKRFRDGGAHQAAMPTLLDHCDEASVAHWSQDTDDLPDAAVVLERMRSIGRLSKVRHPSPDQQAGQTAPDSLAPRLGRSFTA